MALTDADRNWLLENIAKRIDLGFARDQIMSHMGKDPNAAPVPAGQRPDIEVARRVDVGYLAEVFRHGNTEAVELLRALLIHLGVEVPEPQPEPEPETAPELEPEPTLSACRLYPQLW